MVTPPRARNAQIPVVIDDIVMRALAGSVSARYQRAEELLADLLRARSELAARRPTPEAALAAEPAAPRGHRAVARPAAAPSRVRTREVAGGRFCWNCHKPLPARTASCPFCGETQ
jgi:hypothetical protein